VQIELLDEPGAPSSNSAPAAHPPPPKELPNPRGPALVVGIRCVASRARGPAPWAPFPPACSCVRGAGEFYFDRSTRLLSVFSPSGTTGAFPGGQPVYAPQLTELLHATNASYVAWVCATALWRASVLCCVCTSLRVCAWAKVRLFASPWARFLLLRVRVCAPSCCVRF
jgi:hypothetical protein